MSRCTLSDAYKEDSGYRLAIPTAALMEIPLRSVQIFKLLPCNPLGMYSLERGREAKVKGCCLVI